jgi:hypothetical protein
MQHHLGVRGRLADGAARDDVAPQRQTIGEIAVVADGDATHFELGKQRLHIAQDRFARGRIPHMPHRHVAGQLLHDTRIGEVIADETEMPLGKELPSIEADDARRFLPAMLQRMEAERREGRGFGVAQNAEHATLFVQRVAMKSERIVKCHALAFRFYWLAAG